MKERRGRLLIGLIAILVGLLSVPTVAVAGRGGNGNSGKLTATIDMLSSAESSGDGTWFAVTRSRYDHKSIIWVTNTCYDAAGNVVVDRDKAVMWGEWNSLNGEAGPFFSDGATCTAYVTLRPWHNRPLGDAVLVYSP